MREETTALEQLWEQEQQGTAKERKWWQDGEYDSTRADESNDQGLDFFKSKNFSEAFQCFTEAIRLCPTSAVYHSNRAAAALKLGRADIAAEDADEALQRDPHNIKALLRGGQARLRLRHAQEAHRLFSQALDIDPENAIAKFYVKAAVELEHQLRNEEQANQTHAEAGTREALPRSAPANEEAITAQLSYATQLLSSNPDLEAAKCSLVESLLLCGRYHDALTACEDLRPGVERRYLEAESLWRQGDVEAALSNLREAALRWPNIRKCRDLEEFLAPLVDALGRLAASLETEAYVQAIEDAEDLLNQLDTRACCGLYCRVLRSKAEAAAGRRQWESALQALRQAIDLQSFDTAALRMRANVHKKAGNYMEYFLDVQRLKRIDPGAPGLVDLVKDAASLCMDARRTGGRKDAHVNHVSAAASTALRELGLADNASLAEVRQTYLRLAGEWHPDKWAIAEDAQRNAAEERFKSIQAAYETLTASPA